MGKQQSDFCLNGTVLGFDTGGEAPFKYLNVLTAEGEQSIKLGKSLRLMLCRYLVAGDYVRVVGRQKIDAETGLFRLKAYEVVKLPPTTQRSRATAAPTPAIAVQPALQPAAPGRKNAKRKAKILVCQKSSCRKRGGDRVCEMLETQLAMAGLTDQVSIQLTGCMDRCKAGPNVVVMPDKTRYTHVTQAQIPALIKRHYLDTAVTF